MNNNNTFKVGDKVELLVTRSELWEEGVKATVTEVFANGRVEVRGVMGTKAIFNPSELELVAPSAHVAVLEALAPALGHGGDRSALLVEQALDVPAVRTSIADLDRRLEELLRARNEAAKTLGNAQKLAKRLLKGKLGDNAILAELRERNPKFARTR